MHHMDSDAIGIMAAAADMKKCGFCCSVKWKRRLQQSLVRKTVGNRVWLSPLTHQRPLRAASRVWANTGTVVKAISAIAPSRAIENTALKTDARSPNLMRPEQSGISR